MTRAALLAAALALAACSPDAAQSCPGQAVFDAVFDGSLVHGAIAGDRWPADPVCPASLGFPGKLGSFQGRLSAEAGTGAGALCRGGQVLFGVHSGGHWEVEASSGGAVLGPCGSTCAATSHAVIVGDVLPDPVNPTSFVGSLVERLTRSEGACDACTLPCVARYALTGTGSPP